MEKTLLEETFEVQIYEYGYPNWKWVTTKHSTDHFDDIYLAYQIELNKYYRRPSHKEDKPPRVIRVRREIIPVVVSE